MAAADRPDEIEVRAFRGQRRNFINRMKKVNGNTFMFTEKKGGKTTLTGKIIYAKDGKSRTVTVWGKGADGKKFTSTAFYDKS